MDVLKGFSERLIELMQENGLNAEKLSKKLGVAPTIIRRWCLPQKIYTIQICYKWRTTLIVRLISYAAEAMLF